MALADEPALDDIKLGGCGAHVDDRHGREPVLERGAHTREDLYLKKTGVEQRLLPDAAKLGDGVVVYGYQEHIYLAVGGVLLAVGDDEPVEQDLVDGHGDIFARLNRDDLRELVLNRRRHLND